MRARRAPRCLEGFDLKKKMKKRKDGFFGLVRGFKQKICMHARNCRGNRGEIALLSKHKSGVVTTGILLYVLLYVLLRVFCYMFRYMFGWPTELHEPMKYGSDIFYAKLCVYARVFAYKFLYIFSFHLLFFLHIGRAHRHSCTCVPCPPALHFYSPAEPGWV